MREIDPGAQHSGQYANTFSVEENQQFTVQFAEITQLMADEMAAGALPTDAEVQELIRRHYDFCLKFWTPTRDAYISLALSYVLPSPYHDAYEAVATGLGKFHYDAIVAWANENLD
jgi:hypothetical protein